MKDMASADRKPIPAAGELPGLRREPEQPWHFSAVGEPAAGPPGAGPYTNKNPGTAAARAVLAGGCLGPGRCLMLLFPGSCA